MRGAHQRLTLGVLAAVAAIFALALAVDAESLRYAIEVSDTGAALAVAASEVVLAGLLIVRPRLLRGPLLAALLVATASGGGKVAGSTLWQTAKATAERTSITASVAALLDAGLPDDAQLYVVDQAYDPNSLVVVRPQVGDAFALRTPSAASRFVMADLAPGDLLGHPIRYTLVTTPDDPAGPSIGYTATLEWFATIGDVRTWRVADALEVRGHPVAVLVPGPVAASTEPLWGASVSAFLRDLTRGSVAAASEFDRRAIVVDGGDDWINVWSGPRDRLTSTALLGRLAQIEVRRSIRDQADQIGSLAEDYGYGVTRFSGLAIDPNPAPTVDRLRAAIVSAGKAVGPKGELYLHFIAHGNTDGLVLFDKGTCGELTCTFGAQELRYADLATMLSGLDPSIKKIVAIDACHSGAAEAALKGIPGLDLHVSASADGRTPAGINDGRPSYTKKAIAHMKDLSTALSLSPVTDALKDADAKHAAFKGGTQPSDSGPGLATGGSASPSPTTRPPPPTPATATLRPAYPASYEGAMVTASATACEGGSSWLLQGGQKHLVPDKTTVERTYATNGGRCFTWAAADIAAVPNGSPVASVATPAAPVTTTAAAACAGSAFVGTTWSGAFSGMWAENLSAPYDVSLQLTFGQPRFFSGGSCNVPITSVRLGDTTRTWALNTTYPYASGTYNQISCSASQCTSLVLYLEQTSGSPINSARKPMIYLSSTSVGSSQISGYAGTGNAAGGCCGPGSFRVTRR